MKKATMFSRVLMTGMLAVVLVGVASLPQDVSAGPSKGPAYTFQTISFPDSPLTLAYGINNSGDIVGTYHIAGGADGTYNGFVRRADGSYSGVTLSIHSDSTYVGIRDINEDDQVVGWWNTSGGYFFGAINVASGGVSNVDINTTTHAVLGMNDYLQVVGWYQSGSGYRGFVGTLNPTTGEISALTDIAYPNSPDPFSTYAYGINNDGDVVGYYKDANGKGHGFLWSRTANTYTPIDYPGTKIQGTFPAGINSDGLIVGSYADAHGKYHGFLRNASGTYTTIDYKSAVATYPQGINDNGEIVGYYDTRKTEYGFIATPQ